MGGKAGRCSKTSTPQGNFIVIPSLQGWPTKVNKAPSIHNVRLTIVDEKVLSKQGVVCPSYSYSYR